MSAPLQEITVTYLREQWRRESFAISIVRGTGQPNGEMSSHGQFGILGDSEPGEFLANLQYRLWGSWDKSSEKFGPQFKFRTFVVASPHGRQGIVSYLQQCRHVGGVTATKLYDKFAGEAVRILRENPDVASAAIGGRFPLDQAAEAAEDLERLKALEDVTIELTDLIHGRGFPKGMIREAIGMWGNRATQILKRDPYKSMAFRGIGFKKADAFYLDIGLPPAKLKRQAYCLAYAAASASDQNGHVWISQTSAVEQLKATVGGTEVTPDKAITLATRGGILELREDPDGTIWCADARRARTERYVCEKIVQAFAEDQLGSNVSEVDQQSSTVHSVVKWPFLDDPAFASLSDHQRQELAKALVGPVGLFGGGPGCGKTFSAARLIDAIIRQHGLSSIAICAPTGKAAVRCTQALQANGVQSITARTIHGLLGVESSGSEGWSFRHREGNPLPYRFLIIDESSMLSLSLMSSLLSARARGCGILFIGDVNQLPPVEYGSPLRDFIAAGLPYGELREPRRNAGTIVRACAAIRDGQPIPVDEKLDLQTEPPANLILVNSSKSMAVNKLLNLIRNIRDNSPHDCVWDCQVIVAVNKRSPLSRNELNKCLQRELNPNDVIEGSPFRLNDKVIQLKNGFLTNRDDQDEKLFVANGEIGKVLSVEPKKIIVDFTLPGSENKKVVVIPRGAPKESDEGSDDEKTSTGCDLDLAYAITCHKAQGSGMPIVIVMLDEYAGASGPFGVCDRAWLFTAFSRAEKACFAIGTVATMNAICSKQFIGRRKTFTREILGELAEKYGVRLNPLAVPVPVDENSIDRFF